MMKFISHNITEEEGSLLNLRLDRYISERLCLFSRSQTKVRNIKAKINGKNVKLSRIVKHGDFLEISWDPPPPVDLIPQDIPLNIIYEDDKCIVINKEQGMVVHPAAGNRSGTLANALYFRRIQKGCAEKNENIRPGIVHRLDKDTSGIIIAAYDENTHVFLSDQFKSRNVKKIYAAIVNGSPKEIKGYIETFISRDPKNRKSFTVSPNGKHSITFYKVIKKWQNHSLLLLRPKTGRTHQIRVHLRHIGCPILGDPVYGCNDKQFPNVSLMLHSKKLTIKLPDKIQMSVFSSNLPDRFLQIINKLNKVERTNG